MFKHTPHSRFFLQALIAVIGLVNAPSAFAYLDPGTGSIIIQGLIAGIAMIGVTARMYWHKFTGFFGGEKPPEEVSVNAETGAEEATAVKEESV